VTSVTFANSACSIQVLKRNLEHGRIQMAEQFFFWETSRKRSLWSGCRQLFTSVKGQQTMKFHPVLSCFKATKTSWYKCAWRTNSLQECYCFHPQYKVLN